MYFWVLQGLHFEELVTKICFGAKDVIHCVLMVLLDFSENFLDLGGPWGGALGADSEIVVFH